MYKTCPSCGDEFVLHIAMCPDCRVPLQTAEELASGRRARDEAGGDSASSFGFALASAVMLRRGAASELREISELLAARGVRFVVDTDPPGSKLASAPRGAATGREVQLAIYVEEADASEAAVVQHEWMLATVPGAAEARASGMLDACPGCGDSLSASATACASCGLEFPPLEVACPQCRGGVAPESESCPHCGYRP
jgi:hypothetical protein